VVGGAWRCVGGGRVGVGGGGGDGGGGGGGGALKKYNGVLNMDQAHLDRLGSTCEEMSSEALTSCGCASDEQGRRL